MKNTNPIDVNKQECITCNKKLPVLAWYDAEALILGQIDYFLEGDHIHSCLVKHLIELKPASF